jgi:predicted PurR-regulated permease PerM
LAELTSGIILGRLLRMSAYVRDPRDLIPLWALAIVALLFFLRAAASLLIPVVLGFLISAALEPVVAWLARHHLPRAAGTSLLLITLVGLSGWASYRLQDEARQAIDSLPAAAARARELAINQIGRGAGASIRQAADELNGTVNAQSRDSAPRASAPQDAARALPDVSGLLRLGIQSVFALAGYVMVIFFLVFFLLLSGHHIRSRLIEIAGADVDRRRTVSTIVNDINSQIERFLLVRLVTSALVGVLTWVVLVWFGVQNAAFWGILAGVFNSIPYFGPVIVSGGLFVVGLAQDGGGIRDALEIAGAALVITSIEGWLITPPLMGKAERMSALAVFLGLLLWTWVWGAWGTILAVPMLVILKSVSDHVPGMKPVGRLMAP